MQIDFHHTVTYVVARLANFSHDDARIISYAAQYVDNCTISGTVEFDNGHSYDRIASAHEIFDLIHHLDVNNDCRVWVPFHFLPGNVGAKAGEALNESPMKRLVCTPDSPVATDMWNACGSAKGQPNALHRLGITCHVYEDTFAHSDFAGVLDNINDVSDVSHGTEAFAEFVENVKSKCLQIIPLGHGAVFAFPDLPFLHWSFRDSEDTPRMRNNPERFLLASEQLFHHLLFYRGDTDRQMIAHDRDALMNAFNAFTEENGEDRHSRWLKLIREGGFSFGGLDQTQADSLLYAARGPRSWKYEALGPDSDKDDGRMHFHYMPEFEQSNWYRFHEALKSHRSEVLNNLLPKYRISLPLNAVTI